MQCGWWLVGCFCLDFGSILVHWFRHLSLEISLIQKFRDHMALNSLKQTQKTESGLRITIGTEKYYQNTQLNIRSVKETPQPIQTHIEQHLAVGSYIKSVVYGSMDGVINTTIILLTGVASNTPVSQLFSICLSAIIAGALDMGLCDYLSSKSEMQFIGLEEERQLYEIEHFLEEQQRQMVDIYKEKGFNEIQASRVVQLLSTSKKVFLNVMMMEQLGLVKQDDWSLPTKCGIATFIAFFTSSFIYFFPYLINKTHSHPWLAVLCISTVQLISLGIAQAKIIGLRVWKSAVQFVMLGVVASGIGVSIGLAMRRQ